MRPCALLLLVLLQSRLSCAARVALSARAPVLPAAPAPTISFSPISFGGDATGRNDSSAAVEAALSAALAVASANALPPAAGSGGVAVDLGGGTYLLSRPLLVRGGAFGVSIRGGTLLADATFPSSGCLIDVQGGDGLVIMDLTLDNAHVGGGLRVDAAVQITVTRVFFLHYRSFGIWGDDAHGASHELMVDDCFFAEFMWGEAGFDNIASQNGTAIWLASQFYDSNFYNSIIRCTRQGVVNLAGANLFHGLHIYSTCNKDPSGGNVTVGFVQGAWGQTRIASSYFDDSPLVMTACHELTLKDNLFYGLSALIFAPASKGCEAAGVFVSGNLFTATSYSGAGPTIHYDTAHGDINASSLTDVVVADNSFSPSISPRLATRFSVTASASAPLGATLANLTLDVRSSLLFFPTLAPATASFNWRASLLPSTLAALRVAGIAKAGQQSMAAGKTRSSVSGAFGGAISQLHATAVLTGLTDADGHSLPLAGSGLYPTASVYPSAEPGVLALEVRLGGGLAEGTVPAWTALVTLSIDQAVAAVSV